MDASNVFKNKFMGAYVITVCKITFEKWVDTLSGHDKVSMDTDRIVWT